MENQRKKLIFGVFCEGKLVFAFNTVMCTERQAEVMVRLLDLAKDELDPGHYFAYDYAN